jgi:hypothetical protein
VAAERGPQRGPTAGRCSVWNWRPVLKPDSPTGSDPVAVTLDWLDGWVIDLGLCPFAAPVRRSDLIRAVACDEPELSAVLECLQRELTHLTATPRTELATTLIVLPTALADFDDYCDFLAVVDDILEAMELTGTIQVASFHPDYRFDGVASEDASNYTNRSPFPILHLLRELDVSEAVDGHSDPHGIPDTNVARLRALGIEEIRRRYAGRWS